MRWWSGLPRDVRSTDRVDELPAAHADSVRTRLYDELIDVINDADDQRPQEPDPTIA